MRASDVMKSQTKLLDNKTCNYEILHYLLEDKGIKELVSEMDITITSFKQKIILENNCQLVFLDKL